jgi:hypothetical protein
MKKVLILTVALILVLSGMAFAGVATSKHNMVTNANNGNIQSATSSGRTDQVCVFCHHPHKTNASTTLAQVLWNRNGQGNSTDYLTYKSGIAAYSAVIDGHTLNPTSDSGAHHTRLCLSCHDSTQAVSVVDATPVGFTGTYTGNYSIATAAQANIGGDANTLQNDHPVDFSYTAAVTANSEFPTASNNSITNNGRTYPLYGNSKMECGTCHDPHNSATSAGVQFIRNSDGAGVPLSGSALCSDCHTNH